MRSYCAAETDDDDDAYELVPSDEKDDDEQETDPGRGGRSRSRNGLSLNSIVPAGWRC